MMVKEEELEISIEEKRNELAELRKRKSEASYGENGNR